jgi:hypothetical protein
MRCFAAPCVLHPSHVTNDAVVTDEHPQFTGYTPVSARAPVPIPVHQGSHRLITPAFHQPTVEPYTASCAFQLGR